MERKIQEIIVEKIPDTRISVSEDFAMRSPSRDVEFDIVGANLEELKTVGKAVLDKMKSYPGAVDVKSTLDPGNVEARIILDRDKIRSYGIDPVTVGQIMSYSILGGNRGDTVTVKTGSEEIDVMVRLPKDNQRSIRQIEFIV